MNQTCPPSIELLVTSSATTSHLLEDLSIIDNNIAKIIEKLQHSPWLIPQWIAPLNSLVRQRKTYLQSWAEKMESYSVTEIVQQFQSILTQYESKQKSHSTKKDTIKESYNLSVPSLEKQPLTPQKTETPQTPALQSISLPRATQEDISTFKERFQKRNVQFNSIITHSIPTREPRQHNTEKKLPKETKNTPATIRKNTTVDKENSLHPPQTPEENWPWWPHVQGRKAILIGGDPREPNRIRIQQAFKFSELTWVDGDIRRIQSTTERIRNSSLNLVILITSFLGHKTSKKVIAACKASKIPCVFTEKGHGILAISQAITHLPLTDQSDA